MWNVDGFGLSNLIYIFNVLVYFVGCIFKMLEI